MKIINIIKDSSNKKELFIGSEADYYQFKCSIKLNDKYVFNLDMENFERLYFFQLRNVCGPEIFMRLLKVSKFKESLQIKGLYLDADKLPVYYKICKTPEKEFFLVCISFGEKNKGVYCINLDAYWEVEVTEDIIA